MIHDYKSALVLTILIATGCTVMPLAENTPAIFPLPEIKQEKVEFNKQQQIENLSQQAAFYLTAGKVDKAINNLDEALKLSKQNNDKLNLSLIFGQLSDAYLLQKQLQSALHYAQKAVEKAKQTNHPEIQAVSLNYLGNSLFTLKNYDKAREAYNKAIYLLSTEVLPSIQAALQINLCNLYIAIGQIEEAEKTIVTMISFVHSMPISTEKIFNLISAGNIILQIQNLKVGNKPIMNNGAFEIYNEALILSKVLGFTQGLSYSYGHLAELYVSKGQTNLAETLLTRALFFAEQSDQPDLTARWQWQFAKLLQQEGSVERAKTYYAKALASLNTIQSSLLYGRRGRESIDFDQWIYLDYINLLLQEASIARDDNQRTLLLKKARDLVENANSSELTNYFQDECVEQHRKKKTIVSLDERIQPGTAVLYTIIFPDHLVLLLNLTGGEIKQFFVPVSQLYLTKASSQFRHELSHYGNPRKIQKIGKRLYDWLIQPISKTLNAEEIKTLVIVPTGILRTIPFAALHNGKQFLINDYALTVTPGLELTSTGRSSESKLYNRVLLNGLSESVEGFSALPYVKEEMNRIQPIYENTLLMNKDFRYLDIKNHLQKNTYSAIVFATHSQFNQDVNQSFLLSYDGKINLNQLDILIRLNQFHEPPIDLLVLSACETAVGDERAALGMAGSAVKAGAGSVVASLWLANDASTATLIPTFFENLKKHRSTKAEALQKAQKAMLNSGPYQHPFHWAAFLLIGNWL